MPKVNNVLFLCTGNSARSVMAEAILNRDGADRYRAFSAGSRPKGEVHPLTLETMREHGLGVAGLRSKSWDEFGGPDSPRMDMVVTVCASAAGESCPIWPGRPAAAHWGFDDPAAATGSRDEQRREFRRVFSEIEQRIREFLQS